MGRNTRQHFVPKFVIKNFKRLNGHVFVADKDEKRCYSDGPKRVFQKKYFYNKQVDEYSVETRLNKEIEDKVSKLINRKILKKDKIRISREELRLVKKFILVQLIRTDFYRDKFEEGFKAVHEERFANESPRDQWYRYIECVLDNDIENFVKDPNLPKLLRVWVDKIHTNSYLGFFRSYPGLDFVLPSNGVIKEPASTHSFLVFPVHPKLSIVLIDTVYKDLLSKPEVYRIFEEKIVNYYPRHLIEDGLCNHLSNSMKNSISNVTVPVLFFKPNEIEYKNENYIVFKLCYNMRRYLESKESYEVYLNEVLSVIQNKINFDTSSIMDDKFLDGIRRKTLLVLAHFGEPYEIVLKVFRDVGLNTFMDYSRLLLNDNDIFEYESPYLDNITNYYLTYMLMEESKSQFVFKSFKAISRSFIQEYFWKNREYPLPDLEFLKDKCKEKAPTEFNQVKRDIEYNNDMIKKYGNIERESLKKTV